tara:strand:+ start:144 stop:251 length:108 start_codon:yes stop_codon:yes gene_type:complete
MITAAIVGANLKMAKPQYIQGNIHPRLHTYDGKIR